MRGVISASIAYLVSWLIGALGLRIYLKSAQCRHSLILFLAPGAGLFAGVFILYLGLYLFNGISRVFALAANLLLLIVLCAVWRRAPRDKRDNSLVKEWKILFAVLCLGALFLLAVMLKSPFGSGLDVWAIWKMKARVIYYSPEWRSIFSLALRFSHPDYPLFYPLAMIWGWLPGGRETPAASFGLALIFTLSLIGIVVSAAAERGTKSGWLCGLFLISVPHFIGMGGSQYADILVAYFYTAAVVLMDQAFREGNERLARVSGVFAGMSSFVKNEGLLFFVAFCVSLFLFAVLGPKKRRPIFRRFFFTAAQGGLFFLAFTAFFKYFEFYPNHMLKPETIRYHLTSGDILPRTVTILSFAFGEFFKENSWVYVWPVFWLIFILYPRRTLDPKRLWIFLAAFFVNVGYACVYLVTALGLSMQLEASLDRVMIHTFPAFTYFFLTGAPFAQES